MVSIGSSSTSASPNSQKENDPVRTLSQRIECPKSSTMPEIITPHYYNVPLRYADDSASSTVSSRTGAPRPTAYFYEKDDEEPILSNRFYHSNFEYDAPSPVVYRHPTNSFNRIQSPTFYTAPHSLPRVSMSSYRTGYGSSPPSRGLPVSMPNNSPSSNVTCVKACNGVKNK